MSQAIDPLVADSYDALVGGIPRESATFAGWG